MKKNKLLNIILRGSTGGSSRKTDIVVSSVPSELDREPLYVESDRETFARASSRQKQEHAATCRSGRQSVKHSASILYTNEQSLSGFTVNSSPSILDDLRSHEDTRDVPHGTSIEKSQSWSGNRILESASESGNSRECLTRGKGIDSNVGGTTAHKSYRSSKGAKNEHIYDTMGSMVYEQDPYMSYREVRNYDRGGGPLSPLIIDSEDAGSGRESSKFQRNKRSSRSIRQISPRRSPLINEQEDSYQDNRLHHKMIQKTSPSLSPPSVASVVRRSSTKRMPLSPRRADKYNQNFSLEAAAVSRSSVPYTPPPFSPAIPSPMGESHFHYTRHSPVRSSMRMSTKRSFRSQNRPESRPETRIETRVESRPVVNEFLHIGDRRSGNVRSLSYEERNAQLPKPLWKTRSWQQPRNQPVYVADRGIIIQNIPHVAEYRQMMVPKDQLHVQTNQKGQSAQHFTKSMSWQQSYEADQLPEKLSRTCPAHERRDSRRSAARPAPSSSRGNSVSPVRSSHNVSYTSIVGTPNTRQDAISASFHQGSRRNQVIYSTSNVMKQTDTRAVTMMQDPRNMQASNRNFSIDQYKVGQKYEEKREKIVTEVYQSGDKYIDDPHKFTQDQYVRRLHQTPFTQQLSFSHAYSQPAYNVSSRQPGTSQARSGSQRIKTPTYADKQRVYHFPEVSKRNEIYEENITYRKSDRPYEEQEDYKSEGRNRLAVVDERSNHVPPIKSASLMSSVELLNTLKRQLALSIPDASRSKSVEVSHLDPEPERSPPNSKTEHPSELSSAVMGASIPAGRLSPALQALVAEKRARLKRSTKAFTGSGRARFGILKTVATTPPARCSGGGRSSDSECEEKKSTASSTADSGMSFGGEKGSGASGSILHQQSHQGSTLANSGFLSDSSSANKQSSTSLQRKASTSSRTYAISPPQGSTQDLSKEQSYIALLKTELKLVSRERDNLKRDLKLLNKESEDHYSTSNRSSACADDKVESSSRYSKFSVQSNELLKASYEKVLMELQSLRKQNQEVTRKYESAIKEADYYRTQEKSTYSSLQNLRLQYEEVIAEKEKLEHEVNSLQNLLKEDRKDMTDYRRQQESSMSQDAEAVNQLYIKSVQKYDSIKEEYDTLRARYSDVASLHSSVSNKLEEALNEVVRLTKQNEELLSEKNYLKQQCSEAIRQWDSSLRDKNKLEEENKKVRKKCEDLMQEMSNQVMHRQHLGKDVKKLQEERNSVMQEYALIMGERDQVHKEMDRLHDELHKANALIKSHQQTVKDRDKERESLLVQLEMLRREIASALQDRDNALKELAELHERTGAHNNDSSKHWHNIYKDDDGYGLPRELSAPAVSPCGTNGSSSSHRSSIKERLDDLDQANQEIDRLRKTVEKLQGELQGSLNEAEISRRRRDWAFSERDKIVRERESIRTLSDKLRREKERTVSRLAEVLGAFEDVKLQREQLATQLRVAKEQLEEMERCKLAVAAQKLGMDVSGSVSSRNSSSKDSAIHTSTPPDRSSPRLLSAPAASAAATGYHPRHQQFHLDDCKQQSVVWDYLNISVQMGNYFSNNAGSVGFELAPARNNSSMLRIATVYKDSPFYGKLRDRDELVRVEGADCCGADAALVYDAVQRNRSTLTLTVRRKRSADTGAPYRGVLHTSHLHCPGGVYHGVRLMTGLYIVDIQAGSPADIEPALTPGDRIISINGKSVEGTNMSSKEAQQLLDAGVGDVVQITTRRTHCKSCSFSTPVSNSSSSSGPNLVSDSVADVSSLNDKDGLRGENGGADQRRIVYDRASDLKVLSEKHSKGSLYLKSPAEKMFSDKWDHFKSMMQPHRSRKERLDKLRITCASPTLSVDNEKELALSQLDSVINSFHGFEGPGSSTTTKLKKKCKDKSGGTWPKYKGGVLSLYATHLGSSAVDSTEGELPESQSVVSGNHSDITGYDAYGPGDRLNCATSTSNPFSQPHAFKGNTNGPYPITSTFFTNSAGDNPQSILDNDISRKESVDKNSQTDNHSLTPSDTSLDFSVRSGNVGKEELEYYVKKNIVKCAFSDSEGNVNSAGGSNNPLPEQPHFHNTYDYRGGYTCRRDSGTLSTTAPVHMHVGVYAQGSASLRTPHGFMPLLNTHQHPHPHASSTTQSPVAMTLPKSPLLMPLRSQDLHIRSHEHDLVTRDRYDHRPLQSPTPSGVVTQVSTLMSRSPTTGFYQIPSVLPASESANRYSCATEYDNSSSAVSSISNLSSNNAFGSCGSKQLLQHVHFLQPRSRQVVYGSSSSGLTIAGNTFAPNMNSMGRVEECDPRPPVTCPPPYHEYQQRSTASIPHSTTSMPHSTASMPRHHHKLLLSLSDQSVTDCEAPVRPSSTPLEQHTPPPSLLSAMRSSEQPRHIYYSVYNRPQGQFLYRRPQACEIRNIVLEKDNEPLGIRIQCFQNGGVFVSAVTSNSLAEQVGIVVGDQLLEVCGINLRTATKVLASTVLSQCGKSVTILVQNNSDKYYELESWQRSGSSLIDAAPQSGTPTPRNSPKLPRCHTKTPQDVFSKQQQEDKLHEYRGTTDYCLQKRSNQQEYERFEASRCSNQFQGDNTSGHVSDRDTEEEQPADESTESPPPSSTSTLRAPLLQHGSDISACSTLTSPIELYSSLSRQDTYKRRAPPLSEEQVSSESRSHLMDGKQLAGKQKNSRKNSSSSSSGSRGGSNRSGNFAGVRGELVRKSSSSAEGRSRIVSPVEKPRIVHLTVNKCSNLGVRMVGGNALGVFVHAVAPDTPASRAALKPGDRILEYNGHDLRYATAEQASYELAKPVDTVAMLVQYDPTTYSIAQEQPGDSFYVRALFDNPGSEATASGGLPELKFYKGDILYVDNTLYNSVPGVWRAWLLNNDGHKRECGTIPSQDKVEEALVHRGSGVDLTTLPFSGGTVLTALSGTYDPNRRGNTTTRRSFFKRKKPSRSSSRDSKELASFSDACLNSYSDGSPAVAALPDETGQPLAYVRVERLNYVVKRPVLLLGPLWEFVADKLVHDFPALFVRCAPEIDLSSSADKLDADVRNGHLIDFRRRGRAWDVTTVHQVKTLSDQGIHAILDVAIGAVERLNRLQLHPILLMLKFRSHKQVREMCDTLQNVMFDKTGGAWPSQKISQKEAKEMFDLCSKYEVEYKSVISAVVPAVVNVAYMCTQVKACIDSEQSKTLWEPV